MLYSLYTPAGSIVSFDIFDVETILYKDKLLTISFSERQDIFIKGNKEELEDIQKKLISFINEKKLKLKEELFYNKKVNEEIVEKVNEEIVKKVSKIVEEKFYENYKNIDNKVNSILNKIELFTNGIHTKIQEVEKTISSVQNILHNEQSKLYSFESKSEKLLKETEENLFKIKKEAEILKRIVFDN